VPRTFDQVTHLAEMLLQVKLHGSEDGYRKKRGFSEDIEATNAVLFNPKYSKLRKIKSYREWLEKRQPCVFGRIAATNKNVFICLLEEQEILGMKRGDDDLRDTIQDYRQLWKRYALEGLCSSFLVLLASRSLSWKEPNQQLKEICRRLMELYMEIDRIEDDTYRTQREYVYLRQRMPDGKTRILKFSTLPNIFCAQGDGRWWHDHRTPGGLMITSNALGHFLYSRSRKVTLEDTEKAWALENAMRTINNAYGGPSQEIRARLKHCPATFLIPAKEGEESPIRPTSDLRKYSPDHYEGYFHTDHLIPSIYFHKDRDPKVVKKYDDLTLRYIFDPKASPSEHAELTTGVQVDGWYEVKRSMDRLPPFADAEKTTTLSDSVRGRLKQWVEKRLSERLQT
jgi:hypothetical protein